MTDSSITPDVITHVGARKGGKGTGVVVEEEEEGTYASQVLTLPLSRAFHFADPPIRHLRVEVSEATPLISGHVTLPHGTSDLITYGGSYASMDTGSDIPPPDVYQLHLEGQPSPGHGGRAWWEAIQSPQAPNLPHSPRRFEHAAAVTPDGTSWVYGGVVDRTCDRSMRPHEVLYLNDLHRHSIGPTQSSIAFHHQQGAPYIPTPRFQHTLSALPDGSLVLLGGTNGTHLSSMAEITIYHPNRNEWTQKVAKGSIPISRRDHVAVVDQESIIIHGGTDGGFDAKYGDVAILNTITWTWTIPQVINPPPGRFGHTANLVGKTLILAFGITSDGSDGKIYGLDTETWKGISTYRPDPDSLALRRQQYDDHGVTGGEGHHAAVGTIIGATLGSVTALLIVIALVMMWKRRREASESDEAHLYNEGDEGYGPMGRERGGIHWKSPLFCGSREPPTVSWPVSGPIYPSEAMHSPEPARVSRRAKSFFATLRHPRRRSEVNIQETGYPRNVRFAAISRSDELEAQMKMMDVQVSMTPRRSLYVTNPDY